MKRKVNWAAMWAVIKKEFMDSVRNKWIIAMTVVFIILALIVSYFGSAYFGSISDDVTGFQEFAITIVFIMAISIYLISIIGLMLGYGAIVGEKERGSLDLLLSMPISRVEALISKFLGLALVLFISIFLGFGSAGIVIAVFAGSADIGLYLLFLGATFLVGMVFLSVAILLSSVTKRRSTAMGGAVLLWFLFAWIYDIVIVGIHAALEGLGSLSNPSGWFYAAELGSPLASYSFLTTLILSMSPDADINLVYPWFVNGFSTTIALLLWVFIPLVLSLWVLTRKDILR